MKRKLLISAILTILLMSTVAMAGTIAQLSDYGTSNNNTFTAGTLDLKVNGGENADSLFNVTNMHPDSQPTGTFTLLNNGSLPGYLNISNIAVTNVENGITPPEALAGDTTNDVGELGDVVNIRLYIDRDKDGYYSTGDTMFYNGKVSNLPASFKLNESLAAGGTLKINAVIDWWDSANDNLAQGDTMTFGLRFNLTQRQLP